MILEEGTDEQFKVCVVDACLPRVGEYWRWRGVRGDDFLYQDLDIQFVSHTNIETELHNIRVWRWLVLFTEGRLERLE